MTALFSNSSSIRIASCWGWKFIRELSMDNGISSKMAISGAIFLLILKASSPTDYSSKTVLDVVLHPKNKVHLKKIIPGGNSLLFLST